MKEKRRNNTKNMAYKRQTDRTMNKPKECGLREKMKEDNNGNVVEKLGWEISITE